MRGEQGLRAIGAVLAVAVAVGVMGGAWVWWQGRGRIDADDSAQVARGKEVYALHCAQCHGAQLQGQPDWRIRLPSGALPAPPHDASGHTWHHADEYLFAVTKHGLARFAPPDYKSDMPSFVGKLSDADIRASLAYIKSSWPEDIRRRQETLNRR